VTETGAASWVLRIKLKNGRRADVGLGSFSEVSLQRAREEGRRLRKEFRDSSDADPADTRRQAKAQAVAEAEEQRKAAELARVTSITQGIETRA
jgi:hypothetical protein